MMSNHGNGWQFWIDRGGTFTDIVACAPDGALRSVKLLSENPARYEDAAVAGIEHFLQTTSPEEAPVQSVKMGTTVGTNALLERRGEPTVLVITKGLRDALRIGSQQRPEIFALNIQLPTMLYGCVIEADERLSARGEVVVPLAEDDLAAQLRAAHARGFQSVAIVLMHAYRFAQHEQRAAEIAREIGFRQVSVSHQVSPLMKLVARGDTTVVDAYLTPVLDRYVTKVREGLARSHTEAQLLFMQSHGGLVEADRFQGKDCILSGPAGGVVGMAASAEAAGFEQVIGFDMGGTSTDVSLFDGEFERTSSALIAGIRVSAPMMHIHTVAAGGGSRLRFASGRLQVGPDSAGARPGPACYRNDGPLTVTDANVYLGRIQADFFPAVFGPNADQPIDTELVHEKFVELAEQLAGTGADEIAAERVAAGFLRIAVENMANAIKQISIQRGHDVTQFALACFGGAGGQHACQVADALGINTILIHSLAGVLSAYGMGVADLRSLRQRTVEAELDDECHNRLVELFSELRQEARADLALQQVPTESIELKCRALLRIKGSDSTLPIAWDPSATIRDTLEAFHRSHARHFGFHIEDEIAVVESLEVEAIGASKKPEEPKIHAQGKHLEPAALRDVWMEGGWTEIPIYQRELLKADAAIEGPAIVAEANATTVVESDWRAKIDSHGQLILSRSKPSTDREHVDSERDPIMLEIFNNLFMHIAEQMGTVLKNTAHSVNIKERVDFSCAVFDANGDLIANAPHLPVHLGSMGESVRTILRTNATSIAPGDVYMLNAPYNGGTHLPDITVVTPVFGATGHDLRFIVANRAHHADVGGSSPGSMPANSHSIEDEGVVFDNVLLVHERRFRESQVRTALAQSRYPARNPDQNIADLKAQIAANVRGVSELRKMVERFGLKVVHAYMSHIKNNAEECVRNAIDALRDGTWTVGLDTGDQITVTISIDHDNREATIDFAGTSAMSPGNFNAPASVARAAVLYVFRTLVEDDIPLNEGCMKPLTVRLPEGSLVNPRHPAAVVAGNVETSQCVTDALLAALGVCAASQGTMNNFTFGNDRYQYYETLCGGAGAGPEFSGASAVHTHMTNSRLTDPEVLEWRYPVRVRRFEIRSGSGGTGKWHGGDGIIRELEFLEPMQGAILSNRRIVAPFGLAGGGSGAVGNNYVVRASGESDRVAGTAELDFAAGDCFVIETPGGGGYGA